MLNSVEISPLILIADDDPGMRMLLRRAMEMEGYRVEVARDGEECLELYRYSPPDMVLLDALMPGMDGFACCQAICSPAHSREPEVSLDAIAPPPPVLMITSLNDPQSVEQAFEAGATDYITKPVHWAVLRQRVRRLLDSNQMMQKLRHQGDQERLINSMQERIRQSLDLEAILTTTAVEVRQFLQTDRVILFQFEGSQQVGSHLAVSRQDLPKSPWSGVVAVESVEPGWLPMLGMMIHDPCFGASIAGQYREGRTRAIDDIETAQIAPCHAELLAQFQVRANLVVPILQTPTERSPLQPSAAPPAPILWGLLIAHHCRSSRHWQAWEAQLLQRLASQVAIAIQQSELYHQVRSLNTDLERQVQERTVQLQQSLNFAAVFKRITERVRETLQEDQILQTAVNEIAQVLNVDYCGAALYNRDRTTATIAYEHWQPSHPPTNSREFEPAKSQGIGQVIHVSDNPRVHAQLLRGQPFSFYQDPFPAGHLEPLGWDRLGIEQGPERGDLACPTLFPQLATKLLCPIVLDRNPTYDRAQGTIGYLIVLHPSPRPFHETEVHLVQQVASQCAIAIRQARLYQTTQSQVTALAHLNHLKDEFLSTVSHELRTPMSNMKMSLHLLEIALEQERSPHPDQPSRIDRYLQILKTECHREIRLINDLLELQQLDAGDLAFSATAIALTDWLPATLQPFQARMQSLQQTFGLTLPERLPLLETDEEGLKRIIDELLTNACKFTPAQEEIQVTVIPGLETVKIQVCNSGVEIPDSERDRIFDKFYRIPNLDPWKQSGTGLGLALVRRLATHLGGTIQVHSAQQKTCFTLELPWQPLPTGDKAAPPSLTN